MRDQSVANLPVEEKTVSFAEHTNVVLLSASRLGDSDGDHICWQPSTPGPWALAGPGRLQLPTCFPVLSSTPQPPLSHRSPMRLSRLNVTEPSGDMTRVSGTAGSSDDHEDDHEDAAARLMYATDSRRCSCGAHMYIAGDFSPALELTTRLVVAPGPAPPAAGFDET